MLTHRGTIRIETDRLLLRQFRYTDDEDMLRNWIGDINVQSIYRTGENNSNGEANNFSKMGIPAIGLTSGMHKDFHQTTDDVELIDFDGMLQRTKLAYMLLWKLANTSQSPKANS